jgi:hypothetical protein
MAPGNIAVNDGRNGIAPTSVEPGWTTSKPLTGDFIARTPTRLESN